MEQSRILIVEDETIIAMDLEDSLKKFGYNVVGSVMSGEEAVQQAEKHRPNLVLMDIMLEGKMGGIAAATHIRDRFAIPVIFVTAHSNDMTVQKAADATPYGYILKPFEGPELRAGIEIALHKFKMESMTRQTKEKSAPVEQKPAPRRAAPQALRGRSLHRKLAVCTTPLEFLSSIEPFSTLPEKALQTLAAASRFSTVDSGDLISCEGDKASSAFLVGTGRVAMMKTSPNGKQLIVEILLPGDLMSLFIALQELPYPLSARAEGDTKILLIDKAALTNVLNTYPELYHEFAEHFSARLRFSHDLARGLAHDRVEARIASTLATLVPQLGSPDKDGTTSIIEITRQELADLTGTSPETAIRITKAMERDGLLGLERPGIIRIRDLEGLKELAEIG